MIVHGSLQRIEGEMRRELRDKQKPGRWMLTSPPQVFADEAKRGLTQQVARQKVFGVDNKGSR